MHFTTPNPDAEAVLDKLSCMMICVRGNHEDHRYLDGLEHQSEAAVFPVDCYRRVWCLKFDKIVGGISAEGERARRCAVTGTCPTLNSRTDRQAGKPGGKSRPGDSHPMDFLAAFRPAADELDLAVGASSGSTGWKV